MAILESSRLEALAQALAKGLGVQAASTEAGYSRQYEVSRQRAARLDVRARVAEIEADGLRAAADLTPIIDKLTELAEAASKLNSGTGMMAACRMLSEAARLKGLLPAFEQLHATDGLPPELTKEEWLAAFAPRHD